MTDLYQESLLEQQIATPDLTSSSSRSAEPRRGPRPEMRTACSHLCALPRQQTEYRLN
jgi:hypothetical protein